MPRDVGEMGSPTGTVGSLPLFRTVPFLYRYTYRTLPVPYRTPRALGISPAYVDLSVQEILASIFLSLSHRAVLTVLRSLPLPSTRECRSVMSRDRERV
jgi:hypothetical protein